MLRASVWPSSKLSGQHQSHAGFIPRRWHKDQVNRTAKFTRKYSDQNKPAIKSVPPKEPPSASASPSPLLPPENNGPLKNSLNQALSSTPRFNSTRSSSDISQDQPSGEPLPHTARKPRQLLRKLLTSTILLGLVGFTGGVYYSRVNDNFHDFFTEYIPFGEQAVLYLEEREYREKFPTNQTLTPRDLGELTSIPRQSGVSWRVAKGSKDESSGRYADATKPNTTPSKLIAEEAIAKVSTKENSNNPSHNSEKEPSNPKQMEARDSSIKLESIGTSNPSQSVPSITLEVDQPSKLPHQSNRIDPIKINDSQEPLVQDLVKIINDIITVVEVDNANVQFSGMIEKAKTEISNFGSRIQALKSQAQIEADAKIKSEKEDFDRAAKELIRRVEVEMQDQQTTWQKEFHTERERIQTTYEERLKFELERANKINEQRFRNLLLEQAIEMKKKFGQEIKDRVEAERNGRLKKLSELSKTVADLEKLATDWNSVVDFNLKTQQLHVAVEATRAFLEQSKEPRPFVRELVALHETASDNPIVNAAIGSINPATYNYGIPSSAQIIERYRRVATEVRKAALLPADAGVMSQASSYVLSKLLFKKKGLAKGDDVESILARAETLLEEGNLDAAAREINGLKGWPKTLSRDWLDEVRKVLEVRQALDVIATEARLKSLTVG